MASSSTCRNCCFVLSLIILSFNLFILASASTEADVLLSFKTSIEDPNKSLSSWSSDSNVHYCNWTGVGCSSSNAVTSLNLQSLNLSGEISSTICELTNLTVLNLADNLFNQPIPLHLSECTSLVTLNLSNNLIWGTIPDQISGFMSLKVLDIGRNHVQGKIPESIGSLMNLQVLNLASNLLSGSVPLVFGNFTQLVVLDLSQNGYLVSEIPSDIGKLKNLEQLFLQSSGFYGQIPGSFVGLQNLAILDLSQNNLSGEIPPALGSALKSLVSFDVSQNKLSGSFPTSIKECLNLKRFQVQNNEFSGDFPEGLWSLSKIKLIRAENNKFSGKIPDVVSMAGELEQVQIDNNSFASKIPEGLGMDKGLYRFSASLNGFYGELPPNFCDSPLMSIINLSHNSLSGHIPELKKCRKLVSLSLANNSLTGEIPPTLADLPVLTYLDLSDNNLTGTIPQGLQNLKLALFNVSFNQLSGRVPPALISGLPASFLDGNSGLCGPGLPNSCSEELPTHHSSVGLSATACALISIAFGIGTLLIAAGFFMFHRSSKWKPQMGGWQSLFFYPLRVTEHDLVMAMDEKSAVGSCGAFGRVYIISLSSGELVAVKRLVNVGSQTSKALKAEVKMLAKIRNKGIVKVLGFCHSDESIFLIYEYLQRGSLGDLIGKPECQLPWSVRLKIAIGIAQGLACLHRDYVPHLLHRNLKSNNILLDADFEPKLTDFALDRVLGEAAFLSTIASESADSCYIAPELGYSKTATEQMDVYSFGVILLELITGREAEQAEPAESLDIVKWVRRKINITDGAVQVLDPNISNSFQQEMLQALDIAVLCTSVTPEKRPSLAEVVRGLLSITSRTQLPQTDLSTSEESSSLPV